MPQTPHTTQQHRAIEPRIGERAMLGRGLLPSFSTEACLYQTEQFRPPRLQ